MAMISAVMRRARDVLEEPHPRIAAARRLRALAEAERRKYRALEVSLGETQDQLARAGKDLDDARSWGHRLEAELGVQLRVRNAERTGCAQAFRDLDRQLRALRKQVATATAEAIELERRRLAAANELALERRERRRAVQFIAAQDLLDLYATAEDPPDVELTRSASDSPRAWPEDFVDALAPTQRPEGLGERS